MCADSLTKIGASRPDESGDTIKSFIDPSYAANAFSSFYQFYSERRFTDYVLNSCDNRK